MSRFALTAASFAMMATLTGCMDNYATGIPAPFEAQISIPEDLTIASNEGLTARNDGAGVLFLMDILIYSDETGYPMDNIQVELLSESAGVYIIPSTAVKLVGGPSELDESQCDSDGEPGVDANAPDECYWQYDTSSNQYFQFSGDFANAYQPNYMIGPTNEHGVVRAYLYMDQLLGDTGVSVLLGHTSERLAIELQTEGSE